jgi:hypothetical protein
MGSGGWRSRLLRRSETPEPPERCQDPTTEIHSSVNIRCQSALLASLVTRDKNVPIFRITDTSTGQELGAEGGIDCDDAILGFTQSAERAGRTIVANTLAAEELEAESCECANCGRPGEYADGVVSWMGTGCGGGGESERIDDGDEPPDECPDCRIDPEDVADDE